jgi:hypothetical protein
MAQQTDISKMETTQLAVDWLIKKYLDYGTLYYEDMTQARAMEQQQIKDAVIYGLDEDGHTGDWKISVAQKYYNEKHLGIKDL